MSFSDNSIAAKNSGYLQSLVDYVLDVKPFRTKLALSGAVSEEYTFSDNVNVSIKEKEFIKAFLGADVMPSEFTALNVRTRQSNGWHTDLISDGVRKTWPMPNITVPKFASRARRDKFVAGVDDYQGIAGLELGAFDQRKWDFSGITDVRVNGEYQQDGVDYFLTHGVFSFDTVGNVGVGEDVIPHWIQSDLNHAIPTVRDLQGMMETGAYPETKEPFSNELPTGSPAAYAAFNELPGSLLYKNVARPGGTLKDIMGETYEEFVAVCVSEDPATLAVYSIHDLTNSLGTVQLGETFTLLDSSSKIRIQFTFDFEYGHTLPTAEVGDRYEITPFHKITVSPDAPQETWSVIKTNPSGLVNPLNRTERKGPVWIPNPLYTARPNGNPGISIHTVSIERTPPSDWSVVFNGGGMYTVNSTLPGYPKTLSLVEGCSYKDENIAFTIIPTIDGWRDGDTFTWAIGTVTSYKVFGSVSGWTQDIYTGLDAQVGKWFWNGKVGFKIPKLDLFAEVYNSTIATSSSGDFQTWKTSISNNQVLTSIDYSNGLFLTTGQNQIVGASTNGELWTSDVASLYTSTSPNEMLIVHGEGGVIGISTDGVNWYRYNTGVNVTLRGSINIPNFLASSGSLTNDLNCIVVVGDAGTILTSVDGMGWARQDSGTTSSLFDIAWSDDAIIAVGEHGTILKSLDRVTWVPVNNSGNDNHLRSIIFNNDVDSDFGEFIAVGSNGTILRSIDGGDTWLDLNQFPGSTAEFSDIAYGNGKYIAIGPTGHIAQSINGVVWTSYSGKIFNSITFGNGKFVAVGGSTNDEPQFIPNPQRPSVSVMAEPSCYKITFTKPSDSSAGIPGEATVYNNIRGYGKNLKTGEFWEDDWVSFKLDTIPGLYDYSLGDVVNVHIAPSIPYPTDMSEFTKFSGYDNQRYEQISYDEEYDSAGMGRNARTPMLYGNELYPLYHSHGVVIFPEIAVNDNVIIDKAYEENIKLKIVGSTASFPELGAIDDWIPLHFKYSDYVDATFASDTTKPAEFSDLSMFIEAFSAASGERVFYIVAPRFNKTNYAATSNITFDSAFFNKYLKFNTKYTIAVYPDDSYGQHIRVKVTEALKVYSRVWLNLNDITTINITDVDPTLLDIYSELYFGEGPITGYWLWTNADFIYIAEQGQQTFGGVDAEGNTLEINQGILDLESNGRRVVKVKVNSVDIDPSKYTLGIDGVTFTHALKSLDKVSIRILAYASPSNTNQTYGTDKYGWKFITPSFENQNDQAWTYPFSINIEEGGAAIADMYDDGAYDVFPYDNDGIVPFWYIFEKQVTNTNQGAAAGSPDIASSSITEGLQISLSIVNDYSFNGYSDGPFDSGQFDGALDAVPDEMAADVAVTLLFDFSVLQPDGMAVPSENTGLRIAAIPEGPTNPTGNPMAGKYSITLINPNGIPSNLIFAPENNLAELYSVPADLTTYTYVKPDGTIIQAIDPNSVSFEPPAGLTAPFRLWIV